MKFLIVLEKAMVPKSDFWILKRIRVGRSEVSMSSLHQMNTQDVVVVLTEGGALERRNGKR